MRARFSRRGAITATRCTVLIGLLSAVPFVGCSRDAHTLPLSAPYDEKEIGEITAAWSNTGEERAFSGGVRLKEPEVRYRYRLDARNDADDKLFVRLGEMQLMDAEGLVVGTDPAPMECTLSRGTTEGLRAGDIWVPKGVANTVKSFRVSRFAVPLGERGVKRYREWLLQGRPGEAVQVDAEIAKLAAAPACTSQ